MSLSNFQVRLFIIVPCTIGIILINMNYQDDPYQNSTPEFFKLILFLVIICTLGMWVVNKLNSKVR